MLDAGMLPIIYSLWAGSLYLYYYCSDCFPSSWISVPLLGGAQSCSVLWCLISCSLFQNTQVSYTMQYPIMDHARPACLSPGLLRKHEMYARSGRSFTREIPIHKVKNALLCALVVRDNFALFLWGNETRKSDWTQGQWSHHERYM